MDPYWQTFLELHRGLPRLGPGSVEATERACRALIEPGDRPDVIDFGCGSGASTLVLARLVDQPITAVDLEPAFLAELKANAAAQGSSDLIRPIRGDMTAPCFQVRSFDLVWSEGSVYLAGFDLVLEAWRWLIKPGGGLVVSDLAWLTDNPPEPVREFWNRAGIEPRTIPQNLAAFERAGYRTIDCFVLPDRAWEEPYYGPLSQRLPRLREKLTGRPRALAAIDDAAAEIRLRRDYGDSYGCVFYAARKK